jgi:hypothetical protein
VSGRAWAAVVVAATALLGGYLVVRAVDLFRDGSLKAALLGVGVLLLVLLGAILVTGEVRLAQGSQRLGRELFAEGFREDVLPLTASGRVDRTAADALFEKRKAEAEASPEDWRRWFLLATAYDAARDPQRGRRAMRRAIALHGGKGT